MAAVHYHTGRFPPYDRFRRFQARYSLLHRGAAWRRRRQKCDLTLIRYTKSRLSLTFWPK